VWNCPPQKHESQVTCLSFVTHTCTCISPEKLKFWGFIKLFLHLIVYNISDTLRLYLALYLSLQIIVTVSRRKSEGSREEILLWLGFYTAWLFPPPRNWSVLVNWMSVVEVKSVRQIINCHQPLLLISYATVWRRTVWAAAHVAK
jgi:hypothetical protein